jgi:hypothetical protein
LSVGASAVLNKTIELTGVGIDFVDSEMLAEFIALKQIGL